MNAKKLDDTTWPVQVKFPTWLVQALDAEAKHRGVNRMALIIQLCIDGLKRGTK